MTTIYKCDFCDETFRNSRECRKHESTHFSGAERLKYILLHDNETDICDYCKHVYYMYGIEKNCVFKDCGPRNRYKDFVPMEESDGGLND